MTPDRNERGQFYKGMKGANLQHGLHGSRFWRIYHNIRSRCENPRTVNYKKYGGRGITCSWRTIEEFRDDMYESYLTHVEQYGEKNTSIDRIDNGGNYTKENCRWATPKEQGRNTRQNRRVLYQGKNLTIGEWAEETGIQASLISTRLNKGWSIEKTLNKKGLKQYTFNGKTQSLADWSRELGIYHQKLWDRVESRGWSLERAFTTK